MAYPYYYNPYQQNFQSYTPQNYTPTTNPVMGQSGIIWISGLQEAQMYPIAPNNAVALWEKTGKTIYLKSADATGKPALRVYDLVERTDVPTEKTEGDEYVKKSDFAAVVGAVKSFDDVIGALRSDIETIKGDMYGIAGKKKTKKVEAEDE